MLLVISQSKKLAKRIAETFHYMSILAYGATPAEALNEVSRLYRAALIIHPEDLPDVGDYVLRIRSYMKDLPIFALSAEPTLPYGEQLFDGIFKKQSMTPALASKIIEYSRLNSKESIGDYRLAGFDASCDVVGVNYFYQKVNLTKTEAMILRYLIRSYPIPQKSEDILKYAFKASRLPDKSSIRTHISIMNKKFVSHLGDKMIVSVSHDGYRILTPEFAKI